MTSLSRIVSAGIRMYATSVFRIHHQGMAIKGQQAYLECCGRVICGFWAPLSPSFICKAYSFLKTKKKPSPLFTTSPGGSGWCLGLGRQRQRALYEGLPHFQSFPAALGLGKDWKCALVICRRPKEESTRTCCLFPNLCVCKSQCPFSLLVLCMEQVRLQHAGKNF